MKNVFTSEDKARIALLAQQGLQTTTAIASAHKVHPIQVGMWKKRLVKEAHTIFDIEKSDTKRIEEQTERINELHRIIGVRDAELEWLKKSLDRSVSKKRLLIDHEHPFISITRQAQLLGLSRASVYASATPSSPEDLTLAAAIDALYTKHPYYGTRRMAHVLGQEGFDVGRKRIRSTMRLLGLEALYTKENTSKPDHIHRVYPYLLRRLVVEYPNHVWGTDITYIRLKNGFYYLVAVLDWYSWYVAHWELSPTLEIDFCLTNITEALKVATPAIHNSDQGSHFTSSRYTEILLEKSVQISMDGRGRFMDNIFTERLWRTVKYEDVYLKGYATFDEARDGLAEYFRFYNMERPHQSLNYQTPAHVYFADKQITKSKRAVVTETLFTSTV